MVTYNTRLILPILRKSESSLHHTSQFHWCSEIRLRRSYFGWGLDFDNLKWKILHNNAIEPWKKNWDLGRYLIYLYIKQNSCCSHIRKWYILHTLFSHMFCKYWKGRKIHDFACSITTKALQKCKTGVTFVHFIIMCID